jgi:hypothetical protein
MEKEDEKWFCPECTKAQQKLKEKATKKASATIAPKATHNKENTLQTPEKPEKNEKKAIQDPIGNSGSKVKVVKKREKENKKSKKSKKHTGGSDDDDDEEVNFDDDDDLIASQSKTKEAITTVVPPIDQNVETKLRAEEEGEIIEDDNDFASDDDGTSCYCQKRLPRRIIFIECENLTCPIKWFHLPCVNLSHVVSLFLSSRVSNPFIIKCPFFI